MGSKTRRLMYFVVVLFQLLLINDFFTVPAAAKRGGGIGRSGSRTGTSSRGQSNPVHRPAAGRGVGSGIKKPGSSWKKPALAGAAGAVAGAVIGAAISHKLTSGYYKHAYGGRDYYYGDRYYRPSYGYATKCVYPLPNDSSNNLRYDDGYTVKELVFECDGRSEYCCEMECCRRENYKRQPNHAYTRTRMSWWAILLLLIGIIGVISCCAFAVLKYRRNRQNTAYSGTTGEAAVPLQAPGGDYPGGKAYVAQPSPYYPNAPTYPAGGWGQQPPYAPQGPPAYGFNVQQGGQYPRQY